uniref:ORF1+2p n=1 Tax=Secale cereale amalgavirus 1 TaxID=2058878 RepID=A0A2Z6JQ89_9VIRU|nr:TPA_exp: ORF1+2p [Secale cereale amalgavirus 1]
MSETSGNSGTESEKMERIRKELADQENLELTLEEQQAEMDKLVPPFRARHIPEEIFNVEQAQLDGHSFKNYLKLVKTVHNLEKDGHLGKAISKGGALGFWELYTEMTRAEFVKFARWLTSTEGVDFVFGLQKMKKYTSKAKDSVTPRQIAISGVFTHMLQKYSSEVKETRSKYDKEIARMERELRLKRKEKEREIGKLIDQYKPASLYVPPKDEEVGLVARELYEADCERKGKAKKTVATGLLEYAKQLFGQEARNRFEIAFASKEEYQDALMKYLAEQVCLFEATQTTPRPEMENTTWLSLVESRALSWPLPQRKSVLGIVPLGRPPLPHQRPQCRPLCQIINPEILSNPRQEGVRPSQDLHPDLELKRPKPTLEENMRLRVVRSGPGEDRRRIPVSRSGYEGAVRKVIGGGALRSWKQDQAMYRGGGNNVDALLLMSQASEKRPGAFLRDRYSVLSARRALGLPSDLQVPDGPAATKMKNFNNDATAGPFLKWCGVKSKRGLKCLLEEEMWGYYDAYAKGEIEDHQLPFLTARLGFRTKLLKKAEAMRRIGEGKAMGRAVMMMDALEQAASSPLYNAVSHYTFERRLEKDCGFKNTIIRASSDWQAIWAHVKEAEAIVELDWGKFDRERPSQDLNFIVDVVVSCFAPKNSRERRLLRAYKLMMRAALVDRLLVLDDGTVFGIEGMVPSGSLWTGWVDTALNILYLKAACLEINIPSSQYLPMCAGDDNLTLFWKDPGPILARLRSILNDLFRANIDAGEFKIHYPPFHVVKKQACFPPGTDLSKGTSKIMHKAFWEEFVGELHVNEDLGKSHRWEYAFEHRPKFLSFYWLPEGQPIRPTRDNLEKLLWPEGIHKSLDDYEAAVASMVVDNPWNHHNVNHLLMRYVIIQQIRSLAATDVKVLDLLWFSKFRPVGDEEVPCPMVAPWRRRSPHARMEDYPEVQRWVRDFKDFVAGVTSLYARSPTGGVDAYHYMDILRGYARVGEGQFGNELIHWCDWLGRHPVTKYFKAARGFRQAPVAVVLPEEELLPIRLHFEVLREKLTSGVWESVDDFCNWLVTKHHVS